VGVARLLTLVFSNVEFALCIGGASLWLLFAPHGMDAWEALARWYQQSPIAATLGIAFVPYLIAVAFLEPFYVAAGFGIYLNRRVELEAWDIEQDLRHAFGASLACTVLLALGATGAARADALRR